MFGIWYDGRYNQPFGETGMHEVSLGGTIRDYLTGESRERTTYEDLRQALARFLVKERGYDPKTLVPRLPVSYCIRGEVMQREADIACMLANGKPGLLLVFCAGQVHTYLREVLALARLALPGPCPLAVVTDMREAELFSAKNGEVLSTGLSAIPAFGAMERLAAEHRLPPLAGEQREKESRILHTYTGFLKSCCGAVCKV
ncbi:type I restriction enzyme HsdR N-terminal domain-containing protein [Desulfovibrio sp. OttesenSCG-928-G15]|nr:type I restriction enzyme HsdR N-terminal domain-containing protein [Desulfovibrio sp. OttesenSCG-928-G15]